MYHLLIKLDKFFFNFYLNFRFTDDFNEECMIEMNQLKLKCD